MSNELPDADANARAPLSGKRFLAGSDSFLVWIVDDDESFRLPFVRLLNLEADLRCERQFGVAEQLLAALNETPGPDILLLDVDLPGMSGMHALPKVKSLSPNTVVCLWSSFYTTKGEVNALELGANAFVSKYESYETILAIIRKEARAVKSRTHQNRE